MHDITLDVLLFELSDMVVNQIGKRRIRPISILVYPHPEGETSRDPWQRVEPADISLSLTSDPRSIRRETGKLESLATEKGASLWACALNWRLSDDMPEMIGLFCGSVNGDRRMALYVPEHRSSRIVSFCAIEELHFGENTLVLPRLSATRTAEMVIEPLEGELL